MLFNSTEFLFVFLPLVFIGYFTLTSRATPLISRLWLVAASLVFYAWWDIDYLPLLLGSIAFNYTTGGLIMRQTPGAMKRAILTVGILTNVVLLGYFKYTNFLIEIINDASFTSIRPMDIVLPLAISYFTFQQIAYLVDAYRGEITDRRFSSYALFISFFPQLLMGPIVHHKEMLPQFADPARQRINAANIALGLQYFAIGLAKKTLLGDPLTDFGAAGFANVENLTALETWFAALSYVFAYYFDLSGYADMALGVALFFNIKLPINFNSPYRATNFADYWRRWHITLSRFLGDYVYKSLGGNQALFSVIALNIMITFFVSGIWHGAGWNFVVWGLLNGALVVGSHWGRRNKIRMPLAPAWALTFLFIVLTRVLFVSPDLNDGLHAMSTMMQIDSVIFGLADHIRSNMTQAALIAISFGICLLLPNSHELADGFAPTRRRAAFAGVLIAVSILTLSRSQEFLYFQF